MCGCFCGCDVLRKVPWVDDGGGGGGGERVMRAMRAMRAVSCIISVGRY